MDDQISPRESSKRRGRSAPKNALILTLIGACVFLVILSGCLIVSLVLVGEILTERLDRIAVTRTNHTASGADWTRAAGGKRLDGFQRDSGEKGEGNSSLEAQGPPPAGLEYRLPMNVVPVHYDLTLRPYLTDGESGDKDFDGQLILTVNVTEPTNRIVLHAKNLNIHSSTIVPHDGRPTENKPEDARSTETPTRSTTSADLDTSDFFSEKDNSSVAPFADLLVSDSDIVERNESSVEDSKSHGAEGFGLRVIKTYEYPPWDFWIAELAEPLPVGVYDVKLEYSGRYGGDGKLLTGFYKSVYRNADNETRVIATSKFEPTFARLAFPCFDEPAMKAQFTVHLVRPALDGYIALSNMNEEKTEENKPSTGLTTVHFATSVKMSTYLACFIVCDFKYQEQHIRNVDGKTFPFRSYATPAQQQKVKFGMDTGVKVTEYYIKYFDVNYPLPKLDMIAIPDFVSGAMEHWGLVTFRETSLLYDPDTSSTANKQRVASVVAHEISHMWFGNLVTMDWWNELWLNEGFASYMQDKGIDQVYKDWGMLEQFLPGTVHGVMKLDGTLSSHPIVQTVKTPEQITEIFDSITYSKGASIIRMLEDFVGKDRFAQGVTAYLKEHQYGNARTTDLLAQLQRIVGDEMDLTLIMDTWTRQMGLPVVEVTGVNGLYKLSQKRFLADPDNEDKGEPSPYNYRWEIPITYVTDKKKDAPLEWFPSADLEKTVRVDADTKWIKFNRDQIGYYRVNYPTYMWKELSDQLNTNHKQLTASDRAHLLNDVFSLAEARQLEYATALSMTTYLAKEDHYVPWAVAAAQFYTLKKLLYYSDIYTQFTDYARDVVEPAYKNTNWDVTEGDAHLFKLLRVEILTLACSMGNKDCLQKVGDLFKDWIADPKNVIKPDLRALVYNYGMQSAGGEEEWEIMWDRFKKEIDASEKVKLMQGLSFVKDVALLNRFLQQAWDEENVRGQDYFSCLTSISSNPLGTSLVWDYVRENWIEFAKRFGLGERNLGRLIPSITGRFSTEFKLQEMKDFFARYPEAGAGAAARKQALEAVENNIKWLQVNKRSVEEWLNDRNNPE